jgi:hypothetical protein
MFVRAPSLVAAVAVVVVVVVVVAASTVAASSRLVPGAGLGDAAELARVLGADASSSAAAESATQTTSKAPTTTVTTTLAPAAPRIPAAVCASLGNSSRASLVSAGVGGALRTLFMSGPLCSATAVTDGAGRVCAASAFLRLALRAGNVSDDDVCGAVFTTMRVLSSNDTETRVSYGGAVVDALVTLRCAANVSAMRNASLVIVNFTTVADGSVDGVTALVRCPPAAPASSGDGGSPMTGGAIAALTLTLTFVAGIAAVLVRAKLAGDRLRELKRARGDRAYLGF